MKWQTEAMYRRFEAGRGLDESFPVAETFDDWGMYSQVLWGFKKGWVAGVRGDYLHMEDSPFTDDIDAPNAFAHLREPDLVSDGIFEDPAAIQSRFPRGERIPRGPRRRFGLLPVRIHSRRARRAQILDHNFMKRTSY